MTDREPSLERRLVAKRAEALLTVRLTARNDLLVTEQAEGFGVDFVVQITQKNKPTGRLFGIDLKATAQAAYSTHSVALSAEKLSFYKDSPYPICLCFFFMNNDKGFYKWLTEPTLDHNGFPRLRATFDFERNPVNAETVSFRLADFAELDNNGLSSLVAQINRWYDTRASLK